MKKIRLFISRSKTRDDQGYLRLADPTATKLTDPDRRELVRLEKIRTKKRLQQLQEDIELEITEDQVAAKKVRDKKEKNEATIAGWAITKSVDKTFKGRPTDTTEKKSELDDIKDESPTDDDLDAALEEEMSIGEESEDDSSGDDLDGFEGV